MNRIVIDASAALEILLRTDTGAAMRPVVDDAHADLHAPALCDIEVTSGLRRAIRLGAITDDRAVHVLEDYLDLPLRKHGHEGLLGRVFELRANFSAYDGAYVALAEQIHATLLTGDGRLRRAIQAHTSVAALP